MVIGNRQSATTHDARSTRIDRWEKNDLANMVSSSNARVRANSRCERAIPKTRECKPRPRRNVSLLDRTRSAIATRLDYTRLRGAFGITTFLFDATATNQCFTVPCPIWHIGCISPEQI